MQRLGEEKKRLAPQHTQSITQVNEIVKGLGFKKEEIDAARAELAKYMPKEVFFDKYANERGWSLLYAVYAPQIINDFFKEERGAAEKRQSPKSRRIQYEGLGGDPLDYVQSVFMGYHDDQDVFRGGVRSVAVPKISGDAHNPYPYDPTMLDSRKPVCPHCDASFWSASAGNCDPKYKMINGKPLREWRATPGQAPEPIKFNPTTGERQEETGYSYCGGRHPIYDITAPNGAVDIEAAERLSGLGWDQLRDQNRVRTIAKEGALKHYLVDQWLDEAERLLGGKAAYMKFSEEWIFEDGGELFRECRYPIALKSPASVIHDRIARYTFNVSDKKSSGRARKIKVYMCPKCPGEFKDVNDITSSKSEDPVKEVRCDECGLWFNIDELPEDAVHTMQYLDPQVSLNLSLQTEEGNASELIDTIPRRDIGYLEVEMAEIFDIFNEEIQSIARSMNVRGAEHAKEIFEDWIIGGLNYRELTEKYLAGVYKLHYTECGDCGYALDEKSNPNPAQRARYDQGIPVALVQCPRRTSDPRHKVDLSPATPAQKQEVNEWAGFAKKELRKELSTDRDLAAQEKQTEQQTAESIQDDNQRRQFMGTNLIYHGRGTQEGSPGISYQVLDVERGVAQPLPANDPRAYKGEQGVITREIYQPMERLIKAILAALAENPRIRDKHQETLDTLNEWSQQMGEMSTRFAKAKGFCKFNAR